MKAKERDVLKSSSLPELRSELLKTRERLFRVKFKHQVSPLANPMEIRGLRRRTARLETWIGQKEASAPEPKAAAKPAPAKAAKAAAKPAKAK